jgi:hypothetical protein
VFTLIRYRKKFTLIILVFLIISISVIPINVYADSTVSIELEGFRWKKFPLRILVDMNNWSQPEYALAVREAVDIWIKSIWAYCNLFNDTTLAIIRHSFYVSNINTTNSYDVFFTFTSDELSSNVVGLTTFTWNPILQIPKSPIIINITTYSGTASSLFIKNIAMHEFGHSLGLGHTSSPNTSNGPELMYFSTPTRRAVYPSTLDLYALNVLYEGHFEQYIELPTSIPYKILELNEVNPPIIPPNEIQPNLDYTIQFIFKNINTIIQHIWENERLSLIILAVSLIIFILASNLNIKKG